MSTTTREARRALWISFLGLLATAAFQGVVVLWTGSTALLADTIHNLSDALTAIPLALAFRAQERPPTRRFTYGLGRLEDLAGILVVAFIAFSGVVVALESLKRLQEGIVPEHLGALAAASVLGFLGNELVALYRIRVGRRIGSAALVADGEHARADGLTSLAVLAGALGVWAGYPWADAAVGLLISLVIFYLAWEALREVGGRLLDAVDPELVAAVERTAREVPGVEDVHDVRIRWIGHRLVGELHVVVDGERSVREGHEIVLEVRRRLLASVPHLHKATIHVDPHPPGEEDEDDLGPA